MCSVTRWGRAERGGGGTEVFMCILCVVQDYVYVQVFVSDLYARERVCVYARACVYEIKSIYFNYPSKGNSANC